MLWGHIASNVLYILLTDPMRCNSGGGRRENTGVIYILIVAYSFIEIFSTWLIQCQCSFLFFSSSKNYITECPKKGCETRGKLTLLQNDLIILKQQKSQKSVLKKYFMTKKIDGHVHFFCAFLHYLHVMTSQISLKRSKDGE